ncbi:MAG TPA: ATPase, T2SS/T4P/T4SS family [Gemmataceae bacterium]|nr:ATPase, T2SS/T4P/T4SS family [Gemmataceae bacterium]
MATPNDPTPGKKPQSDGTPPVNKPAAAKPAVPGKTPPTDKPAMGKLVSSGPTKPAEKPAAKTADGRQPAKPIDGKAPAKPAEGKPEAKPAEEKAADKIADKPKAPAAKKPVPAKKPAGKAGGGGGGSGGRKIGQVMVDLGFIDDDQLWELLDEAKNSGVLLGQAVLARGMITEDQLLQALAEQHSLKVVNLQEAKPTAEALALVPETMATTYKLVPLSYKDDILSVAISDPANLASLDDLRNFLGIKEVQASLTPQAAITEALAKIYLGKEESIVDIIKELEADPDLKVSKGRETSIDLASLMEVQDAAPVRKLLNMVMLLGIKDHASDIHFEPFEDEYKIRMRCDGILYEMVPPPRHLATAISSRIKVMANLDIAERRLPQDGRIELNVGGNQVDMRVSVLPTMFGEGVVIRILDRSVVNLDITKVGMDSRTLEQFRELIHRPNGIALVTGPTGCGKTTTLYSALNELNEITEKIITTEDPVEYEIDGIVQVPINSDIGVTFASALRAILRQDPDKILVGEIRDLETAQIAVQASLTGHMVFSTLHTNDAPSTITRLRDMGLETYLLTATVEGILAQRLVRKICEDCRTEFEPSQEILMELNLRPDDIKGKKFYYGKGCDRCNNSGHRGRTGIHELILMNDELRDMVSNNASTDQLRAACRKMGMTTLRESGLRALFNGVTTIDEVVRETVLEDES